MSNTSEAEPEFPPPTREPEIPLPSLRDLLAYAEAVRDAMDEPDSKIDRGVATLGVAKVYAAARKLGLPDADYEPYGLIAPGAARRKMDELLPRIKSAVASPAVTATKTDETRDKATDDDSQADTEQLVTLDQAAAAVARSKRTLERYRDEGKLPAPRVEGGGGKPDEWAWSELRPVLEKLFGRKLPERFHSLRRSG